MHCSRFSHLPRPRPIPFPSAMLAAVVEDPNLEFGAEFKRLRQAIYKQRSLGKGA